MLTTDEIRAAMKWVERTPHNAHTSTLAAAVRELYEVHKHTLRDMDLVDEVCDAANVHRFTYMRAEHESIVGRYRAALEGGDE